ncbi:proline-rich protein 36-like isoform X2 [Coregonus clupeaformis]|uniref:proline-rich protein 36-like isoform X2 n=1 Tax=Coregonus clupeaformis TaxID=59861 RepID=UPI001E1C259D|nr:proline-rich protein 36-like isoform X2 [Coregonus clupeaformis]
MFSDTRAPGEHRGYQHSNPHLNLWLHNRFRAHHSDMGLNGQRRRTDANLTYPNRAKEVGFKSQEVINTIHGKERMGPHLNGLGLEEPDLSSQEGSPSRWSQGQSPEPGLRHSASVRNHYTEHSFVWNHRQTLPHPSVKNYVMAPAPAPPKQFKGQDGCKVPVCLEDQLWGYPRQTCQRNIHKSSWVDSATATQDLPIHQSFSSTLSSTQKKVRNSHRHLTRPVGGPETRRDQKDLTKPVGGPETRRDQKDLTKPVEGYNGPSSLHEVIFSTEVPQRNMGGPTLRSQQSPSKHCPTPEDVQTRPPSGHQGSRRGPGLTGSKRSHRKVVRDQIRRVVENLEEVLGGLKDIHQEMKEVVQQIELLTSSIDLSEGDASPSLPSDSSSTSSGVAMGSSHQRPRGEEARQGDAALSSLIRTNSPQRHNPASSPLRLPHQLAPNPHRSSPVRPPTPGLSPLSTNPPHPNTHDPSVKSKSLHYPLNPASNSTLFHTLGLSPHKKSPPPHPSALGPSVTVETQTGPPMRAPRPVSPPRGLKTQTRVEGVRTTSAKSLGLTQGQTVPHGPGRVPGPKGRKPPPYPHNGHFDRGASKGKDPRKAPPYPVKRRLLSTTV